MGVEGLMILYTYALGSRFTKNLTTNRRRNSMLKDRRFEYNMS